MKIALSNKERGGVITREIEISSCNFLLSRAVRCQDKKIHNRLDEV